MWHLRGVAAATNKGTFASHTHTPCGTYSQRQQQQWQQQQWQPHPHQE